MQMHGRLGLLVFLLLIGIDGPGANAVDGDFEPPESREASTLVTVAAPAPPPAERWAAADDIRRDLDDSVAKPAFHAALVVSFPSGLRLQSAAWLSFRRPFAETVSYRTTAPPSRIA